MNNLTPIEKAKKLWIYNIDNINVFPVVILQDHFTIFHNTKKSQYVLTYDQIAHIFFYLPLIFHFDSSKTDHIWFVMINEKEPK
jgi:hypothetical protein